VTFLTRGPGSREWRVVGTDDARPFRVYLPPSRGTADVAAVVVDSAGNRAETAPIRVSVRPFL
jgi:hypothetical protein